MKENKKLVSGYGEIDLLELITKAINTLKRNFISLIVALVIGLGLGFMYFKLVPNVYESEVIITSDILTESSSISVFTNIQKLIMENNLHTLSSSLHLSESQANAIKKIELSTIVEEKILGQDSKTYITITIKSLDNTVWPNLQRGIIGLMENNDFVKVRVAQRKKYFTFLMTKIDHELNDLEIIKTKIMDGKLSSNSTDGMLLLDPTTINSKILELNRDKINFQNSLELVNSVQVVEPFIAFRNPVSPKLTISLMSGALLGLFSFFVFIGINSLQKLGAEENKRETLPK